MEGSPATYGMVFESEGNHHATSRNGVDDEILQQGPERLPQRHVELDGGYGERKVGPGNGYDSVATAGLVVLTVLHAVYSSSSERHQQIRHSINSTRTPTIALRLISFIINNIFPRSYLSSISTYSVHDTATRYRQPHTRTQPSYKHHLYPPALCLIHTTTHHSLEVEASPAFFPRL